MGDVVVVQVLDCFCDLLYDVGRLVLGQDLILFELRVQSALFHVLQDDEEVGGGIEVAVDAKNVPVVEVGLQSDL